MNDLSDEEILKRIDALSPRAFENLTLDLLRAVGFQNLVWRTPGADGGRDIECEEISNDITGTNFRKIWYVECKKYKSSIDWPTIFNKISYAVTEKSDFVLLVTTSTPSPNCETQITKWNKERKNPTIRVWRRYDLPKYIRLNKNVAISHNIFQSISDIHIISSDINIIISKLIQSAHGALSFKTNPEKSIVSASTLVELLSQRLDNIVSYGRFISGPKICNISDWEWLKIDGYPDKIEESGFRAIVAYIRHIFNAKNICCSISDNVIRLTMQPIIENMENKPKGSIEKILFLSMCSSFLITKDEIIFSMKN